MSVKSKRLTGGESLSIDMGSDLTPWGIAFAAAIIATGFGFATNVVIQSFYRIKELEIKMGRLTDEDALKSYNNLIVFTGVSLIVLILIVLIGFSAIMSINQTPPSSGNVTNICVNCSYPVTNIVNNYNVTVPTDHHSTVRPILPGIHGL